MNRFNKTTEVRKKCSERILWMRGKKTGNILIDMGSGVKIFANWCLC